MPSDPFDHLRSRQSVPDEISVKGHVYRLEGDSPIGDGLHSVVWRGVDEYARPRAIKLRPHSPATSASYVAEAYNASKLDSCEVFARFMDADSIDLHFDSGERLRVDAFVEEWIDGVNLSSFLRESSQSVTPLFFVAYVRAMCVALNALEQAALHHNDLHAGNVMIAEPATGSLSAERRIKIVDTGSLTPRRGSSTNDDHISIVYHLVRLWNCIHHRRQISMGDRRFLTAVKPLLRQMLEEDHVIALRSPRAIAEQFEAVHTRSIQAVGLNAAALQSPFEFLSADHIANDRLLVDLFAASCPWLAKVAGPDPCLITGPRGCGKSTILRWLGLRTQLEAHPEKPGAEIADNFQVTGFYISCSSDLQNRFAWINKRTDAQRHRSFIIHYFNLLAVREIIRTLCAISRRRDRSDYWGFGAAEERRVADFLAQQVPLPSTISLYGTSPIERTLEGIDRAIFVAQDRLRAGHALTTPTTSSFLGDVTSVLVDALPIFRQKKIAFLLDDFSVHRISAPIQEILNQIVWERRATHIFKLSSEKNGAVLSDELLATAELSRERLEVDCATEFLALDDTQQQRRAVEFARELLDNRLRSAGYEANAGSLLGDSSWPEGSLGRALAGRAGSPRASEYHGLSCIAQLCSGDVSSLLLVYNEIFAREHVVRGSSGVIPAHIQHAAIVDVSRRLLNAVKSHYPLGQEMYAGITAFGQLVRRILEEGRRQRDGDPSQAPRIEIDQKNGDPILTLPNAPKELAQELIRRAIFIEMTPGLSRHGSLTTLRWHLRRIFLPAFGAALAKNDAIKDSPDWFEWFLADPQKACEKQWASWPRQNQGPRSRLLPGMEEG